MSDSEKPTQKKVEIINSDIAKLPMIPSVKDAEIIYVDLIRGAMIVNEIAKINLLQTRMDLETDQLVNVQVATLAIPASQLQSWGEFFQNMANRGEENSVDSVSGDAE